MSKDFVPPSHVCWGVPGSSEGFDYVVVVEYLFRVFLGKVHQVIIFSREGEKGGLWNRCHFWSVHSCGGLGLIKATFA